MSNGWDILENSWTEIQTNNSAGTVTTTGTLASGQVALGSGATSVTSDLGLTYTGSSTTFGLGIRLGAVAPPTALTVGDTGTSSPRGIMSWQSNTGTDGARLHLRKSRGTFASPTTVVTGDTIGRLVGSAYDGTGFLEMAGINVLSTGTIGTNRVPTQIQFQTATDASPSVLTTALTLNEKQQTVLPAGVVGTPSLTFTGDALSGFYSQGVNVMGVTVGGTVTSIFGAGGYQLGLNNTLGWTNTTAGGAGSDLILKRRAAATLQLGAADAAAPVAQTLTAQGVVAGTTDVAGPALTVTAPLGTGTGASSGIVFKAPGANATGSTQQTANTILTLKDSGTAGVSAPQALFASGTAVLPSITFTQNDQGFHAIDAGQFGVSVSGIRNFVFGNTVFRNLRDTGFFTIGASSDLIWRRRAAATFQFGDADAASPVAQTLTVQGVVAGTADTAGAAWTQSGSVSTGSGAGGALSRRTAYPGAASTVQNTLSTRDYVPSGWTTLTAETATSIATLTFGASTIVGADFLVTIHAADASNNQGITYKVRVNSVRDAAGNTQSTVGIVDGASLPASAGAGTLSATFSVTEGASAATLKCTATSSLTETTLRATWQALANGPGLTLSQP